MKLKTILSVLVVLTLVSNKLVAQSLPALCEATFNISGALAENNDTVYTCIGNLLTFEDASSLDGTFSTRDWVFGDGNEELNALQATQTTHTYNAEGTYTATLTVGSNQCPEITLPKTLVVLGNPQFNVITDSIDCFGNCNGSLTIEIQSVNDSYYNVVWDGGGMGQILFGGLEISGRTITDLCAGDHTAVLTDEYGCTNLADIEVTLTDPDELIATINQGDTLGLCPVTGVTDITLAISGGDGNYQTTWETSVSIAQISETLMQFTPTAESLDLQYSVIVQDGNGCSVNDSIYIQSLPSTLGGSVSVGANPCVDCEVIQYQYSAAIESWAPINTTSTDNFGNYGFGVISNFLPFVIMANPNEVNHPMAVPTFYPQGHLWSTATVFDVCGLTLDKDIDILEPLTFNGSNVFDGTVYYSQSWKTETDEDPIPLIDVVVEKTPPGQAQGREITNANGGYTFTLVPSSDTLYTLYVNIPGIPVNSTYEILADQGNQSFYLLDFCLAPDSSAIDACSLDVVEVNNAVESSEGGFTMYPNPNNGRFTIETGKFAETDSEIRIVDLSGRTEFQKRYPQTPYTINMVNMAEGYYLVQIVNEKEADASPISIMRY